MLEHRVGQVLLVNFAQIPSQGETGHPLCAVSGWYDSLVALCHDGEELVPEWRSRGRSRRFDLVVPNFLLIDRPIQFAENLDGPIEFVTWVCERFLFFIIRGFEDVFVQLDGGFVDDMSFGA